MVYNPFRNIPISGTWTDHAGYSAGGTDLPLGMGTPIPAPAAGTLRITGGSGEARAGLVGTAGRRAILELDSRLNRIQTPPGDTSTDREINPPEGFGQMDSVVIQHLSAFAAPGHYEEGQTIGWSGNSVVNDDGTIGSGQVHLHWHGLDTANARVRIESFIGYGNTTPAGGGSTPIDNEEEGGDMAVQYFRRASTGQLARFSDKGVKVFGSQDDYKKHRETIATWLDRPENAAAKSNGSVTRPPNENNADNFVNLDDPHWTIEVAVRGGSY